MPQVPNAVFSIDINAPIQRVWDEINRPGACPAMFGTYRHGEMSPGLPHRYSNANGKYSFVLGEVIESAPPKRLIHTFRFTNYPEDEASLVTWDLSEIGPSSTRVQVTHTRFAGETKTYKSVSKGWPSILKGYKSMLETGSLPMGARVQFAMMNAMCFMLPKRMRTANLDPRFREAR